MVLRALAAALCLSLCLLSGCRSAKPSSASGNESSSESTAADYSVYEGEWKNSSGDVTLVVEKTHENSIMFSISKVVSGQKNATLQSAVAKIEDDIAAFEFSDDGYGNSGKGKLIFGKESIICSITVDREDGDQWYVQSIAMDSEKLPKDRSCLPKRRITAALRKRAGSTIRKLRPDRADLSGDRNKYRSEGKKLFRENSLRFRCS